MTCALINDSSSEEKCNSDKCRSRGECELIRRECKFKLENGEALPEGDLPDPWCAGCQCWRKLVLTSQMEMTTTVDGVNSEGT